MELAGDERCRPKVDGRFERERVRRRLVRRVQFLQVASSLVIHEPTAGNVVVSRGELCSRVCLAFLATFCVLVRLLTIGIGHIIPLLRAGANNRSSVFVRAGWNKGWVYCFGGSFHISSSNVIFIVHREPVALITHHVVIRFTHRKPGFASSLMRVPQTPPLQWFGHTLVSDVVAQTSPHPGKPPPPLVASYSLCAQAVRVHRLVGKGHSA